MTDVEVRVETIRRLIANIAGLAMVADTIPRFLNGQNPTGTPTSLASRDLGNIQSFHEVWRDMIDWRKQEARDLARVLEVTAHLLARALASYNGTDEEIRANLEGIMDDSPVLNPGEYYDSGDESTVSATNRLTREALARLPGGLSDDSAQPRSTE